MSDDEHDGAPVEPAEEAEDNAAKRPQIQPVPPIRQSTSITPSVNRAPDDLALLHRKVTRILGRSDDIAPIRDNVGNTNKRKAETRVEIARAERTTATSKVKIGKTLSKGNPSDKAEKIPKLDEGMVHIMDQRTIEIKRILEEVYDGLEELYTMHKNLSQTIQDHILSTKSKQASRSPSPVRNSILASGVTDCGGHFDLIGSKKSVYDISPAVTIDHNCNYKSMCRKRITLKIPKEYVARNGPEPETYYVRRVDLEKNLKSQRTSCFS
ncbi:unnamed protein product [Heligmosomoides polygyrus]|uniref:DUF4806 domain-containing protein n=1 Tax=Heligmosomoides polygyrus TaxID=6339 RepID=A0A3P8DBU4_HELPZ|nr:unnamed protein product [Heligmosomoides polygyrus]